MVLRAPHTYGATNCGLANRCPAALVLRHVEKPLITLVLKKTEDNQVRAAHLLGINRYTLRKIKELGIKGPFGDDGEEGR